MESAIAQGARSVNYGDKQVTYHSLDEMIRLRALMQADIDAASGVTRSRSTLTSFSKG